MIQELKLKNGIVVDIQKLTIHQLPEILELQEKVINSLATNSFLQPLSVEEFLHILNGKGSMIGAYDDGQLIAFRAMLEPDLGEEHLGKDTGLPREVWPYVLYSEISNVNPTYRGNGLQLRLGEILMENVNNQQYRYICTTVAPFNIASLKDKFRLGFSIRALKKKYGNLLRYIMMKDLQHPAKLEKPVQECRIAMEDIEEQQKLLQDGWIGIGIEQAEDHWYVQFNK